MDKRIENLAKVIVHYSIGLKKGDLFKIKGEAIAEPFIQAVYKEALKVGAFPYVEIYFLGLQEMFFKMATDEQLQYISPIKVLEQDKIDAYLGVWGTTNTKNLSGVNPKRQQIFNKATEPLMNKFFERAASGALRWAGTQYPTESHAQDAEMSLSDYEEFVFRAGHLYDDDPVAFWKEMEKEQNRLITILNKAEMIHLTADGTDLKLNVKNRKWINCCGHENFPDGEIFTTPHENDVNGTIKYSFPAFYNGREADGVRFTFKDGKVVEASAAKNEEFLLSMLDTDEGARHLGEFAIGTNYEITKFTRNTLFDEKIGGTCHLAVGAAYPETGGINRSGIHWDMVCDLKTGGEIKADGKTIYKDGKFVI
ncbi:MAG: aminopeptidase [Candidatus Zixiibacteriota bacterium]